jgi:hypothetical protein
VSGVATPAPAGSPPSAGADGRAAPWVPLLRGLTEISPGWVVWKNADAALAGHGDVDAAAPAADWEPIARAFRAWATEHGLGPVIECRHPPRTLFLLAVDRDRRELVELDVLGRKYFRGWTLFRAEDLPPLAVEDPRGFRVLRPGAQAVIQLAGNLRWGARPDRAGLRRRGVGELFAVDPEGAVEAARAFGLPVATVLRGLEAVTGAGDVGSRGGERGRSGGDGRGERRRDGRGTRRGDGRGGAGRRTLLALEASALVRAPADPAILARRIRFRLWTKHRCPALRAVFEDDRRLPADVDAWLERVRRGHPVHPEEGPADG